MLTAALALVVAACSTPRPAADTPAPTAGAKPQAPPAFVLSAGCPLGSAVQQGLNIVEITCKPSPRTSPAGPVGVPNAP